MARGLGQIAINRIYWIGAIKGYTKGQESKDHNYGRFPANLIHDGSDEVVSLFPDTKSIKSNRGNINIGQMAGGSGSVEGTDTIRGHNDSGSAARFFYCAKASKADRDEGLNNFQDKQIERLSGGEFKHNSGSLNSDKNGGIAKNFHPTVKPTKLMQYLVKLVTPKGGTVLDPFMGSGSTGKACKLEGFDFIGIELDPEYIEIAKARIKATKPESKLF